MILSLFFFFQAEDGIRDLVRSRGLGDVYKRQLIRGSEKTALIDTVDPSHEEEFITNIVRAGCDRILSLIHI